MKPLRFEQLLLLGLHVLSADSFLSRVVASSSTLREVAKNPARVLADQTKATLFASSSSSSVDTKANSSIASVEGILFSPETIKESVSLLEDATVSFNSSAASQLFSILAEMRQNDTDPSTIAAYLNALLERGPDRKLPLWARLRPLARCSKRARLVSLRRTLDLTTPPPPATSAEDTDEEEAALEQDTLEDQLRRRRRALVSLLRQLQNSVDTELFPESKGPAIRYLETKAVREHKMSQKQPTIFDEDMTARRPQDLETPQYAVVVRRPNTGLEIRRYQPFAVCSVPMGPARPPVDAHRTDAATVSDPQRSSARAFGALAGYLFGKNQEQRAMKMTTPVLLRQPARSSSPFLSSARAAAAVQGEEDETYMSFVLPSDYWKDGLRLAPQPLQGSGVLLQEDQGGDRAVIMFGGYASKKQTQARKEQLLKALAKDKEWEAVEGEPVALAQYNDPFTPPWKRLNEVSVAVQRRQPQP